MSLAKLTELLEFLRTIHKRPCKALSQNFIIDHNILVKIIQLSQLQKGEKILEIGPGPGAITEILLEKGARVLAVEKDRDFASSLPRLQTRDMRLEVFCEDILTFPLDPHFAKERGKVIANLPFHITTPILIKLLPCFSLFSHLFVWVQEEVARRFIAKPGQKEYGAITLFLQLYSKVTYEFVVKKTCFYPAPSVDSAILSFTLHPPPKGVDPDRFFTLTRTAFQKQRKMLRASLSSLFGAERLEAAFSTTSIAPEKRPEELSLSDWLALDQALRPTR